MSIPRCRCSPTCRRAAGRSRGTSSTSGGSWTARSSSTGPAATTSAFSHRWAAGRRPVPRRRPGMRTLHVGLRVADLERSLAFYTGLGYDVIGTVSETGFGSLTMLKLPGDEFATIELVHDPRGGVVDPGGLNHLVVQV